MSAHERCLASEVSRACLTFCSERIFSFQEVHMEKEKEEGKGMLSILSLIFHLGCEKHRSHFII